MEEAYELFIRRLSPLSLALSLFIGPFLLYIIEKKEVEFGK